MKKKFVVGLLLVIVCLLVVGCGDNSSSSSSSGSSKSESKNGIVLTCTNKLEKYSQEYYAEVVLNKKNYQVKSGKIKFSMKYEGETYTKEKLESLLPTIRDRYCGSEMYDKFFPSKECDVKLEDGAFVGNVVLEPADFAYEATHKPNEELKEEDIKSMETYFTGLFGSGTTCETSKK